MRSVTMYDPALEQMEEQLAEVESLLSDYNHDVSEYMSDLEFDEEDFRSTEDRLNTINHLKGKYGNTIGRDPAVQRGKRSLSGKTGGL